MKNKVFEIFDPIGALRRDRNWGENPPQKGFYIVFNEFLIGF